jgi:ectoine hydroxylase-related dioxygenase (phytanoyl-CoA dioxygenase family)
MDQYKYEKYVTDAQNLKQTIDTYGVAIIPNVIDQSECDKMINGMWNHLEHITKHFKVPINRNNEASWNSSSQLYFLHSMLNQHFGIGQSQFTWDLRQNPKIADIFATLWSVQKEDLLVSFDGASFHFPPEKLKKGWFRNNNWLHTDQSYTRNDFDCVQSWVTAYDVNEGDATLTFLENSHLYHKDFAKKFGITDKADWYKLKGTKEYEFYITEKKCTRTSIKCPAGSMVFWDSRLIHMGQEPLKERLKPNFRCVAYLCYTPRSRATDEKIKKKIKYFEDLRTTNHYPHNPRPFPVLPRTYGSPIPKIEPITKPIINDFGRRLIGYTS